MVFDAHTMALLTFVSILKADTITSTWFLNHVPSRICQGFRGDDSLVYIYFTLCRVCVHWMVLEAYVCVALSFAPLANMKAVKTQIPYLHIAPEPQRGIS
jgi:hypothetical protein